MTSTHRLESSGSKGRDATGQHGVVAAAEAELPRSATAPGKGLAIVWRHTLPRTARVRRRKAYNMMYTLHA